MRSATVCGLRASARPTSPALALLLAAALSGCAGGGATRTGSDGGGASAGASSAPAAPGPNLPTLGSPADLQRSPNAAFERQQLARAETAARQGRLGEAALAFEALTLLRPDRPEYRSRLDETHRRIEASIAERLPKAAAAARRGEIDEATQAYLGILALDPSHAGAADALRSLEQERNKRLHLGKYTRNTLTRRAMQEAEMRDTTPAVSPPPARSPAVRNDVEHAAMLAAQGDLDAAIALLDTRPTQPVPDRSTRAMLVDLYVQRAEKRLPGDRAGAQADLQRATRLDPQHRRAAALLRQVTPAGRDGAAPAGSPAPASRGPADKP